MAVGAPEAIGTHYHGIEYPMAGGRIEQNDFFIRSVALTVVRICLIAETDLESDLCDA